MNRVGKFEKVSFEEFYVAMKNMIEDSGVTIEVDEETLRNNIYHVYDRIKLPTRATGGSAGNDFASTLSFTLAPHQAIKIPTGIRVKIDDGWFLACYPRSGLGFKYRLQLDNTVGIIDGDYYYSDNEGHIFLKMTNDNYNDKSITVNEGDKIAQGIFCIYGITYDDNVESKRNGGFGSTGK